MGIGRHFVAATALAVVGLGASLADAAVPTFSQTAWDVVTLDGQEIGGALATLNGGNGTQSHSVVYNGGLYHMWINGTSSAVADRKLTSYKYATSPNGINFTSVGTLSYAGASDPWNPYINPDQPDSPSFNLPKASVVDGEYKLMFWSNGLQNPGYTYTNSVNDIGPVASNLAVTHLGPVKNTATGSSISTLTPMGIVNGNYYALNDGAVLGDQGISRGTAYGDGPQANVATFGNVTDGLVAGAGYTPGTAVGNQQVDIARNSVFEMEEGHLVGIYTISTITNLTGGTARTTKQIFAVESLDDGLTWSSPVGLFGDTSAFTGHGDALTGGFRHPEAMLVGDQVRVYYSSTWLDTSVTPNSNRTFFLTGLSNPIPEPASLGLLAAGTGLLALRRRAAR